MSQKYRATGRQCAVEKSFRRLNVRQSLQIRGQLAQTGEWFLAAHAKH
jgi:hypothetical protein